MCIRDRPTEAQIQLILEKLGKRKEQDCLNCGTCGYSTCREKAIAVFQGKADLFMCLPYMREKAESMSNLSLEHTPNGIDLYKRQGGYSAFEKALFDMSGEEVVEQVEKANLRGRGGGGYPTGRKWAQDVYKRQAMTSPISGPILNRIKISAAKPMTVVSPLAMMEEVDFLTASTMACCTSMPVRRNSANRCSRKME